MLRNASSNGANYVFPSLNYRDLEFYYIRGSGSCVVNRGLFHYTDRQDGTSCSTLNQRRRAFPSAGCRSTRCFNGHVVAPSPSSSERQRTAGLPAVPLEIFNTANRRLPRTMKSPQHHHHGAKGRPLAQRPCACAKPQLPRMTPVVADVHAGQVRCP